MSKVIGNTVGTTFDPKKFAAKAGNFLVTVTKNEDETYKADKTYAELVSAKSEGKTLLCRYYDDDIYLPLTMGHGLFVFSGVVDSCIYQINIPSMENITITQTDIPDLDGYATEQYVDDAIANIDLPTGNASQYRHIATIVFDSPLGGWKITQDEDGNAFSLSHVFIRADLTASPEGRSDGYIQLNGVKRVSWVFSAETGDYKAVMEITMVGPTASMRYMSWGTAAKANRVEEYCFDSSESVITSIQHYTAAYHHGSGSKFEIWGY